VMVRIGPAPAAPAKWPGRAINVLIFSPVAPFWKESVEPLRTPVGMKCRRKRREPATNGLESGQRWCPGGQRVQMGADNRLIRGQRLDSGDVIDSRRR
jgi:hypothetical protein